MITVMFQVLSGAECSCNQISHGLPHHGRYSQMTRDPTLDLGQSQSQSRVTTHWPLHFSQAFSSDLVYFSKKRIDFCSVRNKCDHVIL